MFSHREMATALPKAAIFQKYEHEQVGHLGYENNAIIKIQNVAVLKHIFLL